MAIFASLICKATHLRYSNIQPSPSREDCNFIVVIAFNFYTKTLNFFCNETIHG
jgi:hypothetical protein